MIPIGSNIPSVGIPHSTDKATHTARENLAFWRDQAGVREGEFLLAYFGFINHTKGVDTLLHALALLRTERPAFRLVMIGGRTGSSDPTNATAADQIDQIIAQAGLAPVIQQTGFADDATVSAYLRASDAVVLPYRDGASYRRGSLMAAVAHACVIITTTPQVTIPTFQHGENMLFVSPDDPHALAEQLRLVAADSALRRRLATGAAALAHAFDWDSIAGAYTHFFTHVIETQA
ncbi:glycosyltransferase [bacterium]|nr:glycosyltransferase [bacterium]